MVLIPAKNRIASTFGLKNLTYEENALFQAKCINRLLSFICPVATKNGRWIDMGCGTGLLVDRCRSQAGNSRIGHYFGLDIAFEPLRFLKKKAGSDATGIQADIDRLPFKSKIFEGSIAASVLQWVADPAPVFARVHEILIPAGYFGFSIFINGSFNELFQIRASFGRSLPVYCPEPSALKAIVADTGFAFIQCEIAEEKHYFPDAITLLKTISGMGGAITADNKLTRRQLNEFCLRYEETFRESKGIPLTYRAIVGICRKQV